ncbi:MAG: hypothetical protein JXR62_01495 [Bacilli bacterium]|nr:hypothetical protein [Bacilli bacterium]
MLLCKLCGKSLYEKMNFTILFKKGLQCHNDCIKKLDFDHESSLIPIDYNMIIYDCLLAKEFHYLNEPFLVLNYFGVLMQKYLEATKQSMMLYLDEELEQYIMTQNLEVVFKLSNNPIILLSILEVDYHIFEKCS